jgi:hypothetical protein
MLPALLYFATSIALLAMARRWIARFSLAVAIVLLLLPLTFTGRALLTGRLLAPVDIPYQTEPLYGMRASHHIGDPYDASLMDIACQMIPWRAALRESLARGEWPLWNSHILAGDALAGAAQPAAYSPFTLIALLAKPAESFNFTGAIAFFVALLGAFLFALDLGVSEVAALFGAIGFAFSGPLAFAILWPLAFAWALLPFVLLGVQRRSLPLLTIALTLEILAGHPESVLHVGLLAGLWWLLKSCYVILSRKDGEGFTRDGVVSLIAAAIFAIGLSAIYTLPVIDNGNQSEQHHFRETVFASSPRSAPLREIGAGVLTTLFPVLDQQKWLVPIRTPAFIGIGSLILAAAMCGLSRFAGRGSRMKHGDERLAASDSLTLLALFLFCACAAFQVAPISSLLHSLPLFNVVLNERLLFGASFCAAMLAAIGIERAFRSWTFVTIFVLLAIGTYVIPYFHLTDGAVSPFRLHAVSGELLPLAVATFIAFLIRDQRIALPLFVAVLLVQRIAEDGRWYPALPRDAAYPRIALLDRVGDGRIVARGQLFLPNTSAMYGVDDVRGYEALTFRPFGETYPLWCTQIPIWFNRVDDLSAPMLSMMNVRYALVKESDDDIPSGWRELAREPGVAKLLENSRALPHAFVPRHVRLGMPAELVLPEMRSESDFGERAWIDAPNTPPHDEANGPGIATTHEAMMQRDGWVVVSNAALDGWRASIDGRPAKIARANHAFLAVHVPKGRHALRFAFRPRSFVIGRAVSAITLLVMVVIAFVQRRRTIGLTGSSRAKRRIDGATYE